MEKQNGREPMMPLPHKPIYDAIHNERVRQDKLWGEQNHSPELWMVILMEEVGEVAKAIQDARADGNFQNYREEIVQVAAVAVAMLESHNRDYEEAAVN